MSEYGADAKPDQAAAQSLIYDQSFMPMPKSNVMQWTLADNQVVRKIARRLDSSNCLFLIQE